MKTENRIEKVLYSATKEYLGKMGVNGIADEGNKIIFYVNLDKVNYKEIPTKYRGYKVYIRPLSKVKAFIKT